MTGRQPREEQELTTDKGSRVAGIALASSAATVSRAAQ